MKKINHCLKSSIVLGGLALLASCNLNSSDEGKTEVSSVGDMPACGAASTSGSDITGSKLYVKDEEALYVCSDSGWVVESVSSYEMLPLCTDKGAKPTLGLKVEVLADTSYYRCFKTGWRQVAEDDSTGTDEELVLEKDMVKGTAAAGGVFVKGARVELREITQESKTDSIVVGDSVFNGEVVLKQGVFVVPNISAYADYAELKVVGLFKDPLTGKTSEDSLELKAVVNTADEELSISVVDHILYKRVKTLAKSHYKIKDALVLAQKELFNTIGYSNDADADAANLAIMLILRSNLEEGEFAEALKAFADDFAKDGTWDDDETRTKLADFVYNLENMKVKDEETNEVLLKVSDYRKHIELSGIEAAGFEAFLTEFWQNAYGLSKCSSANAGVVLKNQNEASDSVDAYFTCKSSDPGLDPIWVLSTDYERDTVSLGKAVDGTLKEGNVDKEKIYVFDTTGTGVGDPTRWVEADSIQILLWKTQNRICNDQDTNAYTVFATATDKKDVEHYYACENRKWTKVGEEVYQAGEQCHDAEDILRTVIKYKDKDKVEHYYRCIPNETTYTDEDGNEVTDVIFSWSVTNEDNYKLQSEKCVLYELVKNGGDYFYCDDSLKHNFSMATDNDLNADEVCNKSILDKQVSYKDKDKNEHYLICAEDGSVQSGYSWKEISKVSYETNEKYDVCNEEYWEECFRKENSISEDDENVEYNTNFICKKIFEDSKDGVQYRGCKAPAYMGAPYQWVAYDEVSYYVDETCDYNHRYEIVIYGSESNPAYAICKLDGTEYKWKASSEVAYAAAGKGLYCEDIAKADFDEVVTVGEDKYTCGCTVDGSKKYTLAACATAKSFGWYEVSDEL